MQDPRTQNPASRIPRTGESASGGASAPGTGSPAAGSGGSGAAAAGSGAGSGAGSRDPRRRPERPSREELEKVRARDADALGRFFDRYFDRIHGLAYRILGDRTAAEDVSQEVFLKVHRAADRLDPERDPEPWLVAITCNACREHWRGRHVKAAARSVPLEDVAEHAPDPAAAPDPAEDIDRARRAGRVQRAVSELPETLREVVILHDWRGHSHQEIAEMLGATYAAIRKRYSRALAALAERLRVATPGAGDDA